MSWTQTAAGSPLRRYQRRAVDELLLALAEPGARACLVAPPGAGKTRCALHVASALERPIEVRVPTTTLVDQWRARIERTFVSLGEGTAAPRVHVSTYAGLGSFEPGALVILDECHHLGARWGEDVNAALSADHLVLGLTATPLAPEGTYAALVGTSPVRVDAPPLVRDGHLSPYRDLVWPVLTDPDDVPELVAAAATLVVAERILGERLDTWVERSLREDLVELTEARFVRQEGLLVALCRHQHARGFSLPTDLPSDPELRAPLSLHDRALLLHACAPQEPVVRQALRVAGFRPAGRTAVALLRDTGLVSLAASQARVRGCITLLAAEHAARADGLRALVLTDRDVEAADRLSARQVLRAFVADPRTDALDPVLVTGSAFWVDDDVWPRVQPRVPELPWRLAGDHHEIDVTGWASAERVALATRLLSEGVTRCLVGTRHLLGEGWDCPAVNCVVDLTGIVAPITVNQVRGRAYRLDPADVSKVASIWDVVALAPGVPGGDRMLERLRARHAHTLGVDEAGRVRTGLGRMDPVLGRGIEQVVPQVEQVQGRMVARAADIAGTAALWEVGRDYRDQRVWWIAPSASGGGRPRVKPPAEPLPARAGSLAVRRRGRRITSAVVGAGGLALAGAALLIPIPLALAGLVASGIFLGSAGLAAVLALWRGRQEEAVLNTLMSALSRVFEDAGVLRREGERCFVEGTPEASHRFATAAAQLLGPVGYPRYLLHEADGRVWPIPDALGASRALADIFAEEWTSHVGACQAVYARQGRGRELLAEAWRGGGRQPVEIVEGWE